MNGQVYLMQCHGYYYVGVHTGDIFKDNYFGSGIAWTNVVNKYGKGAVEREIIDTFSSKEERNQLEKQYIMHYRNLYGKQCLNIADGGQGGNLGPEVNKRISEAIKGEKNGMYGKKLSEESRQKISKRLKEINHKPNLGKTFDEEWKKHLSKSHIGKNLGRKHTPEEIEKIKIARQRQHKNGKDPKPHLGKHWYTNGVDSHLYFEGEQPEGWTRGRTIKKKEG